MSIRTYNKDHMMEHAGVTLATPVRLNAPESDDPLVFWTQHEKEPCEVNLHPFATGQAQRQHTGGKKFIPFSGRPQLIRQLAPTIEENVLWLSKPSVEHYFTMLRSWWRVLDAVEAEAAKIGHSMTRVEDVRLVTNVHSEFAHRSRMDRHNFCGFRALLDVSRVALGGRSTFWESPEETQTQKHIPPEEQRRALRFAIKRACRSALERWVTCDRLSQTDEEPEDPSEANLYRHVKHMRKIQNQTGKLLPTADELQEGQSTVNLNSRGFQLITLRETIYPSHQDADAVWHLCLLNTGWNPSTLNTLDVTKKFLFNHFKDDTNDSHRRFVLSPQTYELVGEKVRAGGNEQVVTGQWKTQDGPGHLIKTYLDRVEPLRELLKQQLADAKLRYEDMVIKGADYKARTTQFSQVKTLEQGCCTVWLYVNRSGGIDWISNKSSKSASVDGKQVYFTDQIVHLLNAQRATNKAVPLVPIHQVRPRDFRVWFADYVYRKGNGNMLHVKRALNHARLGTTRGYTNTNILNQEASDAARRFLHILVGELEMGRIDLTILAHLYRYGKLTPEQENLLAQARTLPKSRMKVACKDAAHPPAHLKATANEPCDVQRCMLCLEHAVLLPESLDGIAMRAEELKALQGFLPIETWIEEQYDIELKNNLAALRKFDLNQGLAARKKWAQAIAAGQHFVPGLPLASSPVLLELV
ncbi:hypothetical protein [Rhodoferax sp. BLA1]|uniref:hypothetical protein n=1 Tax=Rhodoferax sp. BLA1 TaxID=2576062 RepID=UPI0015D1C490|nr:hypothetical protein [Rhodoferax sp. BLA1]